MDGFLDCFNGFARNLGDLPHQVSAERKHNICQTRDVGQESVSVFLNEAAIAQECLDSCPLILGSDLRAHLKARRMARRTAKWVLAKNAVSAEHGDALGSAPLAVVDFLGTNAVGDEAGPLALPEVFKTMRTADFNTNDFWHAAVVAEEVLGPRGSDVTAGEGGVERGDTWPFLDRVDQICCSGIREGIGHLVEYVVSFNQANDRGWLRGPEVFESAKVCVLTASEQAMKMLSEDREVAIWVVDAGVMMLWRAASYVELTA